MKIVNVLTLSAGIAVLSSCTWVRLTPEGENVAILSQAEVANCTRTGTTTVEVLDRALINRNPDRVARELRIMARNRAVGRGDAVVPSTLVSDGEQTFVIYQCRN